MIHRVDVRLWFDVLAATICFAVAFPSSAQSPVAFDLPESSGDQSELAIAQEFQKVAPFQWSEWLGPLAPIALSPFFAITCFAGLAQLGGDNLPISHPLIHSAFLKNPAVFWIFAGLTLITSLPRFSKVSKPLAQAADFLEAYAGIIIFLAIRFFAGSLESTTGANLACASTGLVLNQMGILQFSADLLFAVAAALNFLVINGVKFFLEVLVWLIPFPGIDAMLETLNKLICGGLVALYYFNPTLATIVNLVIFTVCVMFFARIGRRYRQMRSLLAGPLWAMVSPAFSTYKGQPLLVFNQSTWEGMPPFSKLYLKRVHDGWEIHGTRWLVLSQVVAVNGKESRLILREGMIINSISIEGAKAGTFTFSKRFRNQSHLLCEQLKLTRFTASPQNGSKATVDTQFS